MLFAVDRRIIRRADHGGDGEFVRVREADVDAAQANGLCAGGGIAVQVDERFAALVRQHLDLAPGEAPRAGAERLHHSLLGGESCGQLRHAAAAESDLFA